MSEPVSTEGLQIASIAAALWPGPKSRRYPEGIVILPPNRGWSAGVGCSRCLNPNSPDAFLPVYDVSDAVAAVVEADRQTAWQALLDVDMLRLGREAALVGMLGALRMLPEVLGHLLHGEPPTKPPPSMRLRDLPSIPMYEGGWILLGERPGEVPLPPALSRCRSRRCWSD